MYTPCTPSTAADVMRANNQNQYLDEKCQDNCNDELDEFASTVVNDIIDGEVVEDQNDNDATEERPRASNVASNVHTATTTPSPRVINANRLYWESLDGGRNNSDRAGRTYEDITLTDTSRYVIS